MAVVTASTGLADLRTNCSATLPMSHRAKPSVPVRAHHDQIGSEFACHTEDFPSRVARLEVAFGADVGFGNLQMVELRLASWKRTAGLGGRISSP